MNDRDAATTSIPRGAGQATWWGEFPLEAGTWGHWRIGPLALWVGRTEHDWQIAYARGDDPFGDEMQIDVPVDLQRSPISADAERHRTAFTSASGVLELRPILADRRVVARPDTTFSIPSRQQVSVFVTSAVWIRLGCGPQKERLLEVPTWRASDTWFGDNRSGFLCYATRTTMRLDVDELPPRPHRAVTPVLIDNQGTNALNIERISLPMPNLSVFASPAGSLWTERLHLTRKDDVELAHVHIETDKPPMPGAVRLGEPREAGEDNLLSRVFTGLFG